jgi:hypothetical protein
MNNNELTLRRKTVKRGEFLNAREEKKRLKQQEKEEKRVLDACTANTKTVTSMNELVLTVYKNKDNQLFCDRECTLLLKTIGKYEGTGQEIRLNILNC